MRVHLILVKPAGRKQPDLRMRSRERGDSKRLTKDGPHLIAVHTGRHMTDVNRCREIGGDASVGGEVLLPPGRRPHQMRRGRAGGRGQREDHQRARAEVLSHTLDQILFFYINN